MDIQNHGKNLKVHFPVKPGGQNVNSAAGQTAKIDAAPVSEARATRLIDQVKSGEAVRKQLLTEIQAKVQAGEYQTRAAVEEAAANIVGLY